MFKRIKLLREESNYTIEFISNYLEISPEKYIKFEQGKAYIKTLYLIKLARLYNTSIDYLVNETDIKEKYKL
jgi:transcriptional regulator with XRE-family HTH domain